jgi:hypothetical protein
MDERDRQWRDRDWRRSEQYGRGGDYGGEDYTADEDRSFQSYENGGEETGAGMDQVGYQRYYGGSSQGGRGRDEDFRRSRVTSGGGAYASGPYSGGEAFGRASAGRPSGYQGQRAEWPQTGDQDYAHGGRFYGDDERQAVYRQEYGQGGREYGEVPRGYDAGRQGGGQRAQDYDTGYQRRMPPATGGVASGGVGGYDYERGYGDAGRREFRGDQGQWMRHERDERREHFGGGRHGADEHFEDRSREAGQSLRSVGQKISSWFRGDHFMEGSGGEQQRGYQTDFGRERRYDAPEDRGHRGRGPKGYRRTDERISEEVHERLTDDAWLDASHIDVTVKDGEVTLSGTVENREAKHRAEHLVENLSGVTHVQNNLRIGTAGGLTSSGSGFGTSALEAQMQRDQPATDPGSNGASGLSGRTSTGAAAEPSVDIRTGQKKRP